MLVNIFLGECKEDLKAHEMFEIHDKISKTMDEIKEITGEVDDDVAFQKLKEMARSKEVGVGTFKNIVKNYKTEYIDCEI